MTSKRNPQNASDTTISDDITSYFAPDFSEFPLSSQLNSEKHYKFAEPLTAKSHPVLAAVVDLYQPLPEAVFEKHLSSHQSSELALVAKPPT
jgi:hypothetical protein